MTTRAERDELRRLIAQNPGVMFVPVPGGLVKELLDEVDRVVADERAARDALTAYQGGDTIPWEQVKANLAAAVAEERAACAEIAKERAQMWDDRNDSIIERSHRAEAFEIWSAIESRGDE